MRSYVVRLAKKVGDGVRQRASFTMNRGDPPAGWRRWSEPEAELVAEAWADLATHDALLWVPPMWRAVRDNEAARDVMRRHAVSAVEQNLLIEVRHRDGELDVRLATGTLRDRTTSEGVDPTVPAGGIDPKLDVTGRSFEEAVLHLRDAVVTHYGAAGGAAQYDAGSRDVPLPPLARTREKEPKAAS